jgi:hypothetical protein
MARQQRPTISMVRSPSLPCVDPDERARSADARQSAGSEYAGRRALAGWSTPGVKRRGLVRERRRARRVYGDGGTPARIVRTQLPAYRPHAIRVNVARELCGARSDVDTGSRVGRIAAACRRDQCGEKTGRKDKARLKSHGQTQSNARAKVRGQGFSAREAHPRVAATGIQPCKATGAEDRRVRALWHGMNRPRKPRRGCRVMGVKSIASSSCTSCSTASCTQS